MPVNALIIRALTNDYLYYGDNFKIECPTGSGKLMNLFGVATEIANRLTGSFCATKTAADRSLAGPENFRATLIGEIICCFTNISMAITAPASAPAIKPDGLGSSPV